MGLNILVGYCGQISLGARPPSWPWVRMRRTTCSCAFLELNFIVILVIAGLIAALVGMLFWHSVVAHQGALSCGGDLGCAVLHGLVFARVKWFTNYNASRLSGAATGRDVGWTIDAPVEKYLFVLTIVVVFSLAARNLTRSAIGRAWMATRDMDVAAEVIGIRPVHAKPPLLREFLFAGVAGALWGFVHFKRVGTAGVQHQFVVQSVVHDHHRRHGIDIGFVSGRGVHRVAADSAESVVARDWRAMLGFAVNIRRWYRMWS